LTHCTPQGKPASGEKWSSLEGDIFPIAFGRENLERMIDNSRRITGLSAEVD